MRPEVNTHLVSSYTIPYFLIYFNCPFCKAHSILACIQHMQKHLYFSLVDILRFFAAFSVVSFHYFSYSFIQNHDRSPLALFSLYGYLGVALFFIISGFVIHFSLKEKIRDYALSRFLRLYPLFWFCCTLTYIITLLVPMKGETPLSFFLYLKNLLIINNGKTAFMIDGSYWTLTIEILFYIGIGLFTYFFSKKRLIYFYAFWLLFGYTVFYCGLENMLFTKLLLARYVPYFVFGGVLALLFEEWKVIAKKRKTQLISLLILSSYLPLFISSVLSKSETTATNHFGIFDTTALAIVTSFFIIVPLCAYLSLRIHNLRFATIAKTLGAITYPLYLLHHQIGAHLISLFSTFGYISFVSVLVFVTIILVSYGISIYEARYRKILHAKIKKSNYFL